MTYKEISAMIGEIGLPYAYYQFPDNTELQPPFICFLFDEDNDFIADGINYQKIRNLTVELYTDNKDFELEEAVETALNEHGLVYDRSETYLDSERMNMVTYTTDVLITKEN
jgi:hypothetical protein